MAKYTLVYRGGGGIPQTPEEGERQMAAWGAWYGALGAAVLDGGAPFGPSARVASAGSASDGAPSGLSGYTIILADTLGQATELARACPVLAAGGEVDVYECIDMGM